MKRFKIAFVLALACLMTVFSAEAKFGWGPKIGTTVEKMHLSKDAFDSDNRCGFTGGLTAEYIFPVVNFGFDVSLMYSYMRANVTNQNGEIGSKSGNFFEIPLHLKYKVGIPAISAIIQPYIYTGPSVAFKLGGEDSYMGTKRTQWGWDLGIGLEFIRHLQLGAGYTFGINNIARQIDWTGNAGEGIKLRNNYWTITLAWMF